MLDGPTTPPPCLTHKRAVSCAQSGSLVFQVLNAFAAGETRNFVRLLPTQVGERTDRGADAGTFIANIIVIDELTSQGERAGFRGSRAG